MTINKTITTSVWEQFKSGLILTLIVGIAAFMFGVHYQKNSAVHVENKVVLSAQATPAPATEVKK